MRSLELKDLSKWDHRFLELAKHVSAWSKDPSTQCGAVIADSCHKVISLGYNGFASGVVDSPERYADRSVKYQFIIHAEVNAILNASRSVAGSTLYVFPFAPCGDCAKVIVQSGITCIVAPSPGPDLLERWSKSLSCGYEMFSEAGVDLVLVT